jgi:hypothetical protein
MTAPVALTRCPSGRSPSTVYRKGAASDFSSAATRSASAVSGAGEPATAGGVADPGAGSAVQPPASSSTVT